MKQNSEKDDTKEPRGAPADAGESHVIGAVDLGTTSVRMAIAQTHPEDGFEILDELVHPVALGSDTFRLGRIAPETLRAACGVLENFARVLREYGVEEYRAVATSAIREASNQDIFVDRIRHETGMRLEVLDAVGETQLTYQLLLPFIREQGLRKNQYSILLDLGGGSTEIMVLQGEDLVRVGSRRLGTARLFHTIACADCGDTQALLESVIRNVVDSTLALYRHYPFRSCVVVNSLLTRALRGEPESQTLHGGLSLPAETIVRIARETATLPPERIPERFGLRQTEAELFWPTILVLERFLEGLDVETVLVGEIHLLRGLLHDITIRMQGEDPFEIFRGQILRSVAGVAEKYQADTPHARQVEKLACQLYDRLAGFLDLGGKDRLYLQIAAILHDIGMFVSERSHHKHGAYLIQWSEIVGLTVEEQNLVSLVARYHRRAVPKPQHAEFMALPAGERLVVSKLAALLRAADALDRGHTQTLRRVDVEIGETDILLRGVSSSDLTVEAAALREKGDLLEEITGMRLRLRREIA